MVLATVLAAAWIFGGSGCAVWQSQAVKGQTSDVKEPVTNTNYFLYLPAGYNPAHKYPLVVSIHGMKPFDDAWPQLQTWRKICDEQEWIAIAPQLVSPDLLHQFPFKNIDKNLLGDEETIVTAVRDAMQRYSVDKRYVMVTGWSSGGYMIHYCGARHPELFTLLAPQGANFSEEIMPDHVSEAARQTPVYIYHGVMDLPLIITDTNAAVRWYVKHGYRNIKLDEAPGGHERHPELACRFFADMIKGTNPAAAPLAVTQAKVQLLDQPWLQSSLLASSAGRSGLPTVVAGPVVAAGGPGTVGLTRTTGSIGSTGSTGSSLAGRSGTNSLASGGSNLTAGKAGTSPASGGPTPVAGTGTNLAPSGTSLAGTGSNVAAGRSNPGSALPASPLPTAWLPAAKLTVDPTRAAIPPMPMPTTVIKPTGTLAGRTAPPGPVVAAGTPTPDTVVAPSAGGTGLISGAGPSGGGPSGPTAGTGRTSPGVLIGPEPVSPPSGPVGTASTPLGPVRIGPDRSAAADELPTADRFLPHEPAATPVTSVAPGPPGPVVASRTIQDAPAAFGPVAARPVSLAEGPAPAAAVAATVAVHPRSLLPVGDAARPSAALFGPQPASLPPAVPPAHPLAPGLRSAMPDPAPVAPAENPLASARPAAAVLAPTRAGPGAVPAVSNQLAVRILPSVQSGPAPLTVEFRAELHAIDSPIVRYRWKLGQSLFSTTHFGLLTFEKPGTYPVDLLVTDAAGNTFAGSTTIRVADPADPAADRR